MLWKKMKAKHALKRSTISKRIDDDDDDDEWAKKLFRFSSLSNPKRYRSTDRRRPPMTRRRL